MVRVYGSISCIFKIRYDKIYLFGKYKTKASIRITGTA